MQLAPQAFPLLQTLQHSARGMQSRPPTGGASAAGFLANAVAGAVYLALTGREPGDLGITIGDTSYFGADA